MGNPLDFDRRFLRAQAVIYSRSYILLISVTHRISSQNLVANGSRNREFASRSARQMRLKTDVQKLCYRREYGVPTTNCETIIIYATF